MNYESHSYRIPLNLLSKFSYFDSLISFVCKILYLWRSLVFMSKNDNSFTHQCKTEEIILQTGYIYENRNFL